jgi:protease I
MKHDLPNLEGKTIAVVVADGFEQSEFEKPVQALYDAGANVKVISIGGTEVKGWDKDRWGLVVPIDRRVDDVHSSDYDGLLLPGGVMSLDILRQIDDVLDFVYAFFDEGKPVAAICHGPQLFIEAGVVDGRLLTSYPSIRTDLENAGARWVDEEVVVDKGLVTSRSPDDLAAFCRKMVAEFSVGIHAEQHA